MDAQIPEKFRKEGIKLVQMYNELPEGTDWAEFFANNASRAYKTFKERRDRRAQRLWEKYGIIEN